MKRLTLLSFAFLLFSGFGAMAQDSTTKEMVGTYKFPAGNVIPEAIVTWENNVLTMTSAEGTSVLERMKGDTFNIVSFSGICVFKRNDTKKIIGVHVDASGYVMEGEKADTKLAEAGDAVTGQLINSSHKPDERIRNTVKDAIEKNINTYSKSVSAIQ